MMNPLDRIRREGASVRLIETDRLEYSIPSGRQDLVDFMRKRKAEIIAALRAEAAPVTCPACAGSGDIGRAGRPGYLKRACWPCSGSGSCSRSIADALRRWAGLGRESVK